MNIGKSLKHPLFNELHRIHWNELSLKMEGLTVYNVNEVVRNRVSRMVRVVFNFHINIRIEEW